jgi:hypothetical protein
MLKNQNNYFVSKGIKNTVIDTSKNVIINEGLGEINFEEYEKRKK